MLPLILGVFTYIPNETSMITYSPKACFNSIVHHALKTCVLRKYVIFEVSLGIYEIPPMIKYYPKAFLFEF